MIPRASEHEIGHAQISTIAQIVAVEPPADPGPDQVYPQVKDLRPVKAPTLDLELEKLLPQPQSKYNQASRYGRLPSWPEVEEQEAKENDPGIHRQVSDHMGHFRPSYDVKSCPDDRQALGGPFKREHHSRHQQKVSKFSLIHALIIPEGPGSRNRAGASDRAPGCLTPGVMYNQSMEPQSWLEVSLIVRPELAEAVAEVLSRFAPGGVAVESTAIQAGADEYGEVTGDLQVRAYLPVDSQIEDTRQKLTQSLHYLAMIEPLPEPSFSVIHDQNWMEAWKQHYRPIEVGKRLLVLPVWIEVPDSGRIPLRIDPGMAFGTGTHPTTQLTLALLEDYLRPGEPVLDIGCGTGILSVAARLLGASAAYGVDVDEQSVAISRKTAADNQVFDGAVFEYGSVKEVRGGIFPIKQALVVVANILAHILIRLLDDGMAELIAPGGVLLLSGILEEKLPEMQTALGKHGLEIIEERRIEDWIGLAVKPVS